MSNLAHTYKVLITAAGGNAALTCLRALRSQAELEVLLVAADADPYAVGFFFADEFHRIPFANELNYIEQLLTICKEFDIDALIPTHSSELPVLATNLERFKKQSTNLCISPLSAVETFRDKWLAYQFFAVHQIPTPSTWLLEAAPHIKPPLFLKPRVGSGSRNCARFNSVKDMESFIKSQKDTYIVQPVLNAPEYTVDILANWDSKVVAAVPRISLKKRDGLTTVAKIIDVPEINPIIQKIVSSARLVGPCNIQFFETSEGPLITDVNLRFAAGGLPLSIAAGINFPLLVLKMCLSMELQDSYSYQKDLHMSRYYDSIVWNR